MLAVLLCQCGSNSGFQIENTLLTCTVQLRYLYVRSKLNLVKVFGHYAKISTFFKY